MDALESVRRWVEAFVIGHNVCPFARQALRDGGVRFSLCTADTELGLLTTLEDELRLLQNDPAIETTLLIHPYVLQRFADYNQFLDLADGLLITTELEGVIQIASFHPNYQFAGTAEQDAENYSNRSPFPLLHLLREDSVSRAVDQHPDVAAIPERNINYLNGLGRDALRIQLQSYRDPT